MPWSYRVSSVAAVVAHAGQNLLRYATDLAGGPADLGTVELRIAADASPAALVATVRASAEVLAAVLEATPEDTRGFHPDGSPDPSGFAAMACDELLVHTDDAARGLGMAFVPDPHLAARVLRRLFPWAPRRELAWPTLRWANGRTALGDRPFLESWRWHCAPLVGVGRHRALKGSAVRSPPSRCAGPPHSQGGLARALHAVVEALAGLAAEHGADQRDDDRDGQRDQPAGGEGAVRQRDPG
jgi:uncharacterized protein (TIGR03083 family)